MFISLELERSQHLLNETRSYFEFLGRLQEACSLRSKNPGSNAMSNIFRSIKQTEGQRCEKSHLLLEWSITQLRQGEAVGSGEKSGKALS